MGEIGVLSRGDIYGKKIPAAAGTKENLETMTKAPFHLLNQDDIKVRSAQKKSAQPEELRFA